MTRPTIHFCSATCLFALAACSSVPQTAPVAVLVEIDRPAEASDQILKAGFEASLPTYRQIDGLERKYFVHSDAVFGGLYLWENRAAADAFFDSSWQDRIVTTYGQSASLTFFDAPVETAGGSPSSAGDDGSVAIVKVGAPWYAPRGTIVSRMAASVPKYAVIQGLDYKIYSIAGGKRVGGIYLWDDADAAAEFYDDAWHARIRDTYGKDAELSVYSAPVVLVNREANDS